MAAAKKPNTKSRIAATSQPVVLSIEGQEVLELYSEYFSTDSEVLKRMLRNSTFNDIIPENSDYLDKYDPTSLRTHLLGMKRFQETPEQRQMKLAEEFAKRFESNKTISTKIDAKKKELIAIRMLGIKANKAKETFGVEKGEILVEGVSFNDSLKGFVALRARELVMATSISYKDIADKGASIDISPAYLSPVGWCNVDVNLHIPFEYIEQEGMFDWISKVMASIPVNM